MTAAVADVIHRWCYQLGRYYTGVDLMEPGANNPIIHCYHGILYLSLFQI